MQNKKFLIGFVFMLLSISNISHARYLQADKLDNLARATDPELLVAQQMGVIQLPQQPRNYRQPSFLPKIPQPMPMMQYQNQQPIFYNHLYSYANQNPVMNTDPNGLLVILMRLEPFSPLFWGIQNPDDGSGLKDLGFYTWPDAPCYFFCFIDDDDWFAMCPNTT